MNRTTRTAIALSATLALGACTSTRPTPIDEPSLHEGLARVQVPGVDAVYRKPNVSLAGYDKILLQPLQVSFSSSFKPESDSALYSMHKVDREKIKQELAGLFHQTSKEVLEGKGGYQLVEEPAKDVLEVQAAIIDLYITAPDVSMQTAGSVRTYTADAGRMTLIAELHDSITGELLSRAYDHREDNSSGMWQWTSSISNAADAKAEIRRWAELLRKSLDASRGKKA